jgi:hypothetical protein
MVRKKLHHPVLSECSLYQRTRQWPADTPRLNVHDASTAVVVMLPLVRNTNRIIGQACCIQKKEREGERGEKNSDANEQYTHTHTQSVLCCLSLSPVCIIER